MIDGKDIKPGAVTNTNVNSSAGIELKKLEKGGSGQIVVTDTAGTQKYVNLSGDVTVDTDGVATVSATVSSGGTGTVGPQGPAGPQGTQGPEGDQGNPGAPGSDASVTKANIDDALFGADTTTLGFVKRTADDDYEIKNFGTGSGTVCQGNDSRLADARTPTTHASTHATSAADAIAPSDIGAEPSFSKNTAHNKNFGTATGTVCQGNDSRLSDTRTPSSTLVHKSTHETGQSDALSPSDIGAEAAFSKNTAFNKNFGTATSTVCQGDDSRLSDTRTPSSTLAHKSSHETGESDALSPSDIGAESAFSKNTGFNKNLGATTGTVCAGDDSRLSDARTPSSTLAHKASHATGGADALSPSDIGAAASGHSHAVMASGNSYAVGFVPIGSATHGDTYLRKDGTWGTPVDTNTTYTSSNFTHNDLTGHVAAEHIDWTADQGATNLHTGNYTNTTYASSDFDHDALTNFVANEHIDWTGASAGTVHASNYTNTTYSAGNSGLVPAAGSAGQFLKHDASWGTPPDTTANETITLGGDVSGSGTTSITCTVDDDSHNHAIGTITGVLNASAGVGSAGKLIKLDAAGHIDSTMINDADISYGSIADVPSTFAPSSHNHAASEITSGTLHADRYTDTTYSIGDGGLTQKNFTTADKTKLDACLEVDDAGGSTTSNTWSASKIASNALYAAANFSPVDKYTATVTGDASGTTIFYVTHNLGTYHVAVSVRHPVPTGSGSASSIDEMFDYNHYTLMDVGHSVAPGVEVATINSSGNVCDNCIAIRFPSAPANGDQYLVTVIG